MLTRGAELEDPGKWGAWGRLCPAPSPAPSLQGGTQSEDWGYCVSPLSSSYHIYKAGGEVEWVLVSPGACDNVSTKAWPGVGPTAKVGQQGPELGAPRGCPRCLPASPSPPGPQLPHCVMPARCFQAVLALQPDPEGAAQQWGGERAPACQGRRVPTRRTAGPKPCPGLVLRCPWERRPLSDEQG